MTVSPNGKQNEPAGNPSASSGPQVIETKEPQQHASNATPASNTSKNEPASAVPNNGKRNKTLWLFSIALVIIALAWFLIWLLYLRFYESTDDAYANGNMITINPAISGSVIAFYADDTDLVKEGQVLVKLDSTNYQVVFDRELATLAETVLEVRQLYNNVNVNKAIVDARQITLENASYNYNNRARLIETKAVSNEDYTHAKDEFLTAQYGLAQAEAQLQVATDAAGNTAVQNHPRIEQQKNSIRQAYYNLKHCDIYAPATGYVAQRYVDVGQWITPNTALMAVIPIDYVWVDANFKETQLTYMRIGQPATVTLDIYGSNITYTGKVLGIASGTGSVFSLIPPQNATGNWIKIVQRLPVRISMDKETLKKYPIRLGLSAYASVDISNQDLPMLAQIPSTKSIGTTNVFDIGMDGVNKLMDKIVEQNLKKGLP